MASTNLVTVGLSMTGQETLDPTDVPAAAASSDRTIRTGNFNLSATLDSTTLPALEKSPVQQALTIGASPTVLDLTAVTIAIGRTEDMTGKKLIAYLFSASSSNAGKVTIEADAANGYDLFGASGIVRLQPGETLAGAISGVGSGKDAVAAADLGVKISGMLNDVIDYVMYFGT